MKTLMCVVVLACISCSRPSDHSVAPPATPVFRAGILNTTTSIDPIARAIQVMQHRVEILKSSGGCQDIQAAWDNYNNSLDKEDVFKKMFAYIDERTDHQTTVTKNNVQLAARFCKFLLEEREVSLAHGASQSRFQYTCPIHNIAINGYSNADYRQMVIGTTNGLVGVAPYGACDRKIKAYWM